MPACERLGTGPTWLGPQHTELQHRLAQGVPPQEAAHVAHWPATGTAAGKVRGAETTD